MRSSLTTFVRRTSLMAARNSRLMTPYASKIAPSTQTDRRDPFEGQIAGLNPEQLSVLNEMFSRIDTLQDQVTKLHAHVKKLDPTFAVDAPDGDSDGHVKEELQEVKHIIEEAALHENANVIHKRHKLEEEVKKFHAKDPEHDW